MSFAMVVCEPPEPIKIQDNFQTIKQLVPEYNHFNFVFHNFSLSTGGIIYSDPYVLNGSEWRLKIYPKGNGVAKGKYLSVFVEMTKAQSNQKKYEYKIELLNIDIGKASIKRQYCSLFDIGECWGYNQFILLEQLEENGYLNDDKLNFVMGIRNPDYRSLSQDQLNYIKSLQTQIKFKQLEKQNSIEQRNIIDIIEHQSSIQNKDNNKILKFFQSYTQDQTHNQRIERKKQIKQFYQQKQKSLFNQNNQQHQVINLFNELSEQQKINQNQFQMFYKNPNLSQNEQQKKKEDDVSEKFMITNDMKIKQLVISPKKQFKIIIKPKRHQQNQVKSLRLKTLQQKQIKNSEQFYFEPKLNFSQKETTSQFINKNKKKSKEKLKIQNERSLEYQQQNILRQPKLILFPEMKEQIKQKKQEPINSALKQKRYLISKKDVSRKAKPIFNNLNQEQQKKQQKISNILEQSKKLQGINYETDFLSNSSSFKQTGTISMIRNSVKNTNHKPKISNLMRSKSKSREKQQKLSIKKSLSNHQHNK